MLSVTEWDAVPFVSQNGHSCVHCNTVHFVVLYAALYFVVGDIFVAVCLVVVFSSGCMPHGLWTQMHTHTHEWKSNCGRKFLSCYDFNAAHFYVAPCQTAHQLWWLPLTFLSPLGFLTNLVLGCRQWDMTVVETNARQRSISFKRTKKKRKKEVH